jgi:iron-sulfur cluster repair protein YtfE (RIC family)
MRRKKNLFLSGIVGNCRRLPGACNTWQALYRGLEELRQDLMQHIHLENNIWFASSPRQDSTH